MLSELFSNPVMVPKAPFTKPSSVLIFRTSIALAPIPSSSMSSKSSDAKVEYG